MNEQVCALEESILDKILPLVAGDLPLLQLLDVVLLDGEGLVLHDEQRPAASPVVCVQPQLLQSDVVHHSHLPHMVYRSYRADYRVKPGIVTVSK